MDRTLKGTLRNTCGYRRLEHLHALMSADGVDKFKENELLLVSAFCFTLPQ